MQDLAHLNRDDLVALLNEERKAHQTTKAQLANLRARLVELATPTRDVPMQDENATMEDEDEDISMPIFSAPCFKERDQGVCKARNCPRVHQMQRDKYGADALAQLPFDKNALRKAQERRG
jgi:protein subunit release factor B